MDCADPVVNAVDVERIDTVLENPATGGSDLDCCAAAGYEVTAYPDDLNPEASDTAKTTSAATRSWAGHSSPLQVEAAVATRAHHCVVEDAQRMPRLEAAMGTRRRGI